MRKLAPIILFAYNRPDHLRQTIEALKKNSLAKQSQLFIFSDASKNSDSSSKVAEVREYLKNIEGFKKISITLQKNNLGLANSIISGVAEVIKKHKRVIVVEDDLISSPNFLEFMNGALNFYEKNKKIFSIGAFTYPVEFPERFKGDVYLSYRCCSWGWATWENRWKKVDWEMKDYEDFKNCKSCKEKFNRGGEDLTQMLKLQMEGKIDSWAIRWCYAHTKNDSYCLCPRVSKLRNIGFDGTGKHGVVTEIKTDLDVGGKKIKFEEKITLNEEINSQLAKEFRLSPMNFLKNAVKYAYYRGKLAIKRLK